MLKFSECIKHFNMQKQAIFWLTALLLINWPSLYYGWYIEYPWFDTTQHFIGGFLVAMLMTGYLSAHLIKGEKIKNTLIVVGATIFIGVIWEFSEYIANQTLIEPFYNWFGIHAYFMGDLQDTMKDFLMDTFGAIAFYVIYSLLNNKRTKSSPEFQPPVN
jgi:uncharacterized membrane protein YjdF